MTRRDLPLVQLRDAASLIPYARNSNRHPAAQLAKLVRSLVEYGWTNPILIDVDGGIVAGHGRLMAARDVYSTGGTLRMAGGAPIPLGQVPVIVCDGWTPAQKRAYVLADNRIALDAELDDQIMAAELAELDGDGFDLSLTGLDDDEIERLLGQIGEGGETLETEGGSEPEDDDGLERLTLKVTPEQAEQIRAAIAAARKQWPCDGDGDALERVCVTWMRVARG